MRRPHLHPTALLWAWLSVHAVACEARCAEAPCVEGARRCEGFCEHVCRDGRWQSTCPHSPWSPRCDRALRHH
jgi:hypothetical protein